MFSSQHLTIVAKIEPWWSLVRMAIVGDEDGGCARIAISPSFPNLLYTVCRSSNVSPLPDTFSTLFFFRDNFDGEVFLYKSAVKDSADL